jgi:alpha-glucosidase
MQGMNWWQRGIVYEVYARSFQDSNGDGVGDLNGILERLDYLVQLGVSAIWISPIYPSPMADFGYDVADYCGIDPIFGTMADFDRLVAEAHRKGLRVILDFVPNHTSDRHPWFIKSRASLDNPKRDWYLWRDQPNNWLSNFGGSAWERDETTRQYYYHSFLKEQPDLNWRNPAVRKAMYDVLRFWLDRGVDGFRVDVIWMMIKDDLFRDNPISAEYRDEAPSNHRLLPIYNTNRPEVHEIVAEIRSIMDLYPDRVLIGEIYLPVEQLVAYYGQNLTGAHLPFNFLLLQTPWTAETLRETISSYQAALPIGAWPNWVLGNHDNSRLATRVGVPQAPVAAVLLLTLPGTLTIYYGEEIGMMDVPIPPNEVQDPAEKNQPGIGAGRDPERTPMLWNASESAGFTVGKPWLRVGAHYAGRDVASQERDAYSLLKLYRRLISLRANHPVLVNGSLNRIAAEGNLLRYERAREAARYLILLNLGLTPIQTLTEPGRVLLSTDAAQDGREVNGLVELGDAQACIIELD